MPHGSRGRLAAKRVFVSFGRAANLGHAQRAQDGRGHLARVLESGERGEGPLTAPATLVVGRPQREARLAGAAGARQRDQPRPVGEEARRERRLVVAPDQRRGRRRQLPRGAARGGGAVVRSSASNGGASHSAGAIRPAGAPASRSSSSASARVLIACHAASVGTIALASAWVRRAPSVRLSLWLRTWVEPDRPRQLLLRPPGRAPQRAQLRLERIPAGLAAHDTSLDRT